MGRTLTLVLLALAALSVGACGAGGAGGGHVQFTGDYVLEPGGTLDEGLVMFAGAVVLEEGSRVHGDILMTSGQMEIGGDVDGNVVMTSGDLEIGGDVDGNVLMTSGDLSVFGSIEGDIFATSGDIRIGPEAFVGGNLTNLGGVISRSPGATVQGTVSEGGFETPAVLSLSVPFMSPWELLLAALARSAVAGVLALLVVALWLEYVARTASTIASSAVPSTATGCIALLISVPLFFVLAITVCLMPLGAIGALILVVAAVFGWSAAGLEVGHRLAAAWGKQWTPPVAAGLGAFILTLVVALVELIPCFGWLVSLIVGSLAIGAAVLTVFGTRDFPRRDFSMQVGDETSSDAAP